MSALRFIVVAVSLSACGPGGSDRALSSVAGKADSEKGVVAAAQFPATVHIPDCTAAKVGKRSFLTAAHCVVDKGRMVIAEAFAAGARLTIQSGVGPDRAHDVTVIGAYIHPSYAATVVRGNGEGVAKADYHRVYDLALIRVENNTPSVAIGQVDSRSLSSSESIYLGGYGRGMAPSPLWGDGMLVSGSDAGPLRYRRTSIADARGTIYRINNGRLVNGQWTVTNGFGTEEEIHLRPGDSGGPVLLDDGSSSANDHAYTRIVGVNSFTNPLYSSFVRLDRSDSARCLCSALTDGPPSARLGDLPLLCR